MNANEKIFHERHVPELIRHLGKIAEALEIQNKLTEKKLILEKKKIILQERKINESINPSK